MTGTDLCVNKPHKARSYLNHLVLYFLEPGLLKHNCFINIFLSVN
jgi:hypothetical protein